MSSKKAGVRALAVAAGAAAALVWAPSALATNGSTTDATWSGNAPVPTGSADPGYLWSNGGANGANWLGGVVPASPLNVLNFPDLTSCDTSPAPATACYTSYDDLGSLDVNQLNFDAGSGSRSYNIYPAAGSNSSITLEGDTSNVGLVSNLGYGNFDLPILLTGSAAQTWNVENGQLYVAQIGDVSGQTTPLTVSLGNGSTGYGFLQVGSIPATGPVTVAGNGDLGVASGSGISNPTLPAVTLTGTTLLTVSTSTTSGAIDAGADNGHVQVLGDPGSTLAINSGNLTLGPTSEVDINVDGNTAGTSSSVDVTNGSVILGGAPLVLDQNFEASPSAVCTTLKTGTTVTVLSASGGISGPLTVNGQTINQGGSASEPILNYCNEPEANAIIHYNANSITATIAGAPVASTTAPKITGTATVGSTLTVSDNGSWTAVPAPSYSYKWESCAGGTCSPISGATSSSYTLTNAELGKTIEAQVTATNTYGSASAFSNSLGPVTGTTSSGGSSSGGSSGGSGGSGGTTTISGSLRAQIRADLSRLRHPHGRRAVLLMLKRGYYSTRFHARARGTLSDVWRTTVRTGHGKHARRHTFVVARATVHAGAGRTVWVKIRLTAAGRRLLRRHLLSLHITASERFLVAGSGWISVTARFTV